ncbi:hypothetical protein LguiB_021773 [Lonicera macranthoides]
MKKEKEEEKKIQKEKEEEEEEEFAGSAENPIILIVLRRMIHSWIMEPTGSVKSSKFRCYVCPQAVCQRCIKAAEFVHVRKKKGFCNNCLKLALLVEEKKDIDSDGERVDFQDLETFEGLFMEYWEIINKKENFTVEDLRAADVRLKMEKNYNPPADLKRRRKSDVVAEIISEDDDDDMDDIEENKQQRKRKRTKLQASLMKSKLKSNKKEFVGWGSKSLVQFLESIGKNSINKLSQHDVYNIINGYVKEKNLFHPQKKKKVICDARLLAVLGRKTVNKHSIYDLLESHFAENLEKSEDEVGYMSEEDDDCLFICERERNSNTEKESKKKEVDFNIPQICFAAIVVKNIKLVYLKRSLLQELSKQNETFERKVIGSFVRVKSSPQDCIKKSYHQLVQVTGTKKSSSCANGADILLQVSDMPNDICISMLSDDDFSEWSVILLFSSLFPSSAINADTSSCTTKVDAQLLCLISLEGGGVDVLYNICGICDQKENVSWFKDLLYVHIMSYHISVPYPYPFNTDMMYTVAEYWDTATAEAEIICIRSEIEEECESLRERVKSGLLKKLTVDELEQKARSLHEDITKHWIAKELALLQILIDRANEKGWRREYPFNTKIKAVIACIERASIIVTLNHRCFTLYECLERRKLLQTSSEQSRLLQMAPTVIPDAADLLPISENVKDDDKQGDEKGSPTSILMGSSEIPGDNLEGNGTSSGDGAVIKKSSNNGDGNEQAIGANTATKVTEGSIGDSAECWTGGDFHSLFEIHDPAVTALGSALGSTWSSPGRTPVAAKTLCGQQRIWSKVAKED